MTHKVAFVEPMLLLPSSELPDGAAWLYLLKVDGYRAIAFKSAGAVHLRSRNNNDFNRKYPATRKALSAIPDETVIDGEIMATDELGRPSFNMLQNYSSPKAPILYYIFDVMVLSGNDVMGESLESRRTLLEREALPMLADPIRSDIPRN